MSNTCPRWLPQLAQCTSVLTMPWLRSTAVSTDPSIGSLKLGQPVPLSNFSRDPNSGRSHPAQENVPGRFSCSSAQLPGASVPCPRITSYCSWVRSRRHSPSLCVTGYAWPAIVRSFAMVAGVRSLCRLCALAHRPDAVTGQNGQCCFAVSMAIRRCSLQKSNARRPPPRPWPLVARPGVAQCKACALRGCGGSIVIAAERAAGQPVVWDHRNRLFRAQRQ